MHGETDLGKLLSGMRPRLQPGTFVFASVPHGMSMPAGIRPVMLFREQEGVTLILEQGEAALHGIAGSFPSRMITLDVHSSLEAVGFLAAVAAPLAAAGIGVNPVAAFHHDHLFVPADRAEEALGILERLAAGRLDR